MDEYESLRKDLLGLAVGVDNYAGAVNRHVAATGDEIGKLWADNAELRDELHAVANRVESLTRAVMADPAEVAQAIVNDANRSLRVACVDYDPVTGETTVRRRGGEES